MEQTRYGLNTKLQNQRLACCWHSIFLVMDYGKSYTTHLDNTGGATSLPGVIIGIKQEIL